MPNSDNLNNTSTQNPPDSLNANGNSMPQSTPPSFISTENSDTPPPPTPESATSASSDAADLGSGVSSTSNTISESPVVITGDSGKKNKPSKSKTFVATILGVLLLVGGVGAGLILTQQNQDVREKAAGVPVPVDQGTSAKLTCGNKIMKLSPVNTQYALDPATNKYTLKVDYIMEDLTEYCPEAGEEGHGNSCGLNPDQVGINVSLAATTCYCPDKASGACSRNCIINNDPSLDISTMNWPNIPDQYQLKTKLMPGTPYKFTLVRTVDQQCGNFQTDVSILGKETCTGTHAAYTTYATHNICPTTAPTPTATATATATPTGVPTVTTAQCTEIRAYQIPEGKTEADFESWVRLTSTDLKDLKAGDKIYLTVVGRSNNDIATGGFDKARFSINGAASVETNKIKVKSASTTSGTAFNYNFEFYYGYTIPAGVSSFKINSQIHHVTKGWM